MKARVALAALSLCACAPAAKAPKLVQLDCSQPFDALQAKVTGQPGLLPAPINAAEPYRTYFTGDGRAAYFITEPGAPAHPAILMQQVAGDEGPRNSGCGYGDAAAYKELVAYITGLRGARK